MNIPSSEDKLTILDNEFVHAISTVVLLYLVLQTFMLLDHAFSSQPICSETVILSSWSGTIVSGSVAALIASSAHHIVKIFESNGKYYQEKNKQKSIYRLHITGITICLVSASSMLLSFFLQHKGVCRDPFG
jgi:hypothetical protein